MTCKNWLWVFFVSLFVVGQSVFVSDIAQADIWVNVEDRSELVDESGDPEESVSDDNFAVPGLFNPFLPKTRVGWLGVRELHLAKYSYLIGPYATGPPA